MKIGVIRFPGTNCDRDVAKAIELAGATPGGMRKIYQILMVLLFLVVFLMGII